MFFFATTWEETRGDSCRLAAGSLSLFCNGLPRMNAATVLAPDPPPDWRAAFRRVAVEDVLFPVLRQVVITILAARAFVVLLRRLGQPAVVGGIAAGLILGPSGLGRCFPGVSAAVFYPPIAGLPGERSDRLLHGIFTTLSQLGLVFLLFLIGLEFDFNHLRRHGKASLAISVSGVALPFLLGLALAPLLLPRIEPHPESTGPVSALGSALFLGTALSITAIPILGRMMMELNITRTRLGPCRSA
jgi:Kef-type K+ transport system membrane component KefB